MDAKHSLSADHMAGVFLGKTAADIKTEILLMAKNTFTLRNAALCLIPLAAVVCALVARYGKNRKDAVKPLIFGAAVYFCYQAGLLGMYLFSMPAHEASYLASYARYHSTILVYLAGAAMIPVLPMIKFAKKSRGRNILSAGLALLSAATVFFTADPGLEAYFTLERANPGMANGRAAYERFIEEENIPQGASCLVISDTADTGYLWFMSRYLLLSKGSWAQGNDYTFDEKTNTVAATFKNYDFVFMIGASPETEAWFRETFGTEKDIVRVSHAAAGA